MEPKSVWMVLKRSISCLLMIALLCNLVIVADLYAADRTDGREVALADAGITLEVTVKTESDGEEVKTVSGNNLRLALSDNGINRADVTCIKVIDGTIKAVDWSDICTNNGNAENATDASYKNLTSILAEEGVKGEDIGDKTSQTSFPKSIKTVVLPEGVTKIGKYAFYECTNLQEITIPDGVTEIGQSAFYKCSSLQEVSIPESVTKIMGYAFESCESLRKVRLPEGLSTINFRVFNECVNLEEINFPQDLTDINDSAFRGCISLRRIVLPDGLSTIERYAFYKCSSIKEITLPKGLSKLGTSAFESCTGLEKVTILEGLPKVGVAAFLHCSSLKEITLPNGLVLDHEDPNEYRNPLFMYIFLGCRLSVLNIVLKEGETAENMTPVQCAQETAFWSGFSNEESPAMFFYLPDGTMLSEDTEPTLDEVAARYLAENDGNTEDKLWYGWEIGRSYEVENHLTHLTTSNENTVWKSPEGDYKAVLSGEGEDYYGFYKLPEQIHVTIGEKEAVLETDYTYDPATGEIVILKASIDGKIVITGEGRRIYYETTVTVKGGGVTDLETSGIFVSTDRMAALTVGGGDYIILTFTPEEGCSFVSLTIDGEKKEVVEDTYMFSPVSRAHTILVEFTEKAIQTPPPAVPPTESPVVTPDVTPTKTPDVMPTQTPAVSQKPIELPVSVPTMTPTPVPTKSPVPDSELSTIVEGLGVSTETAAKIQAVAKELNVSQDTILVTEQMIQSQKTDEDIKGSYFARIQARASQITQKNIKLSWNRVKGADGYEVYGNRCNTKKWIYEYKKMKTIENGNKKSFIDRNCKKGTYHKYIVRAYKIIDGKKVTIAASKTIHVTTTGGKNGNAKSVKVNKKKVSLKAGKGIKLKASEIKEFKPLRHHREVSYESSAPDVATVSKKGLIKAKKKGKCIIFAYAQSGIYKKVKVTIK